MLSPPSFSRPLSPTNSAQSAPSKGGIFRGLSLRGRGNGNGVLEKEGDSEKTPEARRAEKKARRASFQPPTTTPKHPSRFSTLLHRLPSLSKPPPSHRHLAQNPSPSLPVIDILTPGPSEEDERRALRAEAARSLGLTIDRVDRPPAPKEERSFLAIAEEPEPSPTGSGRRARPMSIQSFLRPGSDMTVRRPQPEKQKAPEKERSPSGTSSPHYSLARFLPSFPATYTTLTPHTTHSSPIALHTPSHNPFARRFRPRLLLLTSSSLHIFPSPHPSPSEKELERLDLWVGQVHVWAGGDSESGWAGAERWIMKVEAKREGEKGRVWVVLCEEREGMEEWVRVVRKAIDAKGRPPTSTPATQDTLSPPLQLLTTVVPSPTLSYPSPRSESGSLTPTPTLTAANPLPSTPSSVSSRRPHTAPSFRSFVSPRPAGSEGTGSGSVREKTRSSVGRRSVIPEVEQVDAGSPMNGTARAGEADWRKSVWGDKWKDSSSSGAGKQQQQPREDGFNPPAPSRHKSRPGQHGPSPSGSASISVARPSFLDASIARRRPSTAPSTIPELGRQKGSPLPPAAPPPSGPPPAIPISQRVSITRGLPISGVYRASPPRRSSSSEHGRNVSGSSAYTSGSASSGTGTFLGPTSTAVRRLSGQTPPPQRPAPNTPPPPPPPGFLAAAELQMLKSGGELNLPSLLHPQENHRTSRILSPASPPPRGALPRRPDEQEQKQDSLLDPPMEQPIYTHYFTDSLPDPEPEDADDTPSTMKSFYPGSPQQANLSPGTMKSFYPGSPQQANLSPGTMKSFYPGSPQSIYHGSARTTTRMRLGKLEAQSPQSPSTFFSSSPINTPFGEMDDFFSRASSASSVLLGEENAPRESLPAPPRPKRRAEKKRIEDDSGQGTSTDVPEDDLLPRPLSSSFGQRTMIGPPSEEERPTAPPMETPTEPPTTTTTTLAPPIAIPSRRASRPLPPPPIDINLNNNTDADTEPAPVTSGSFGERPSLIPTSEKIHSTGSDDLVVFAQAL